MANQISSEIGGIDAEVIRADSNACDAVQHANALRIVKGIIEGTGKLASEGKLKLPMKAGTDQISQYDKQPSHQMPYRVCGAIMPGYAMRAGLDHTKCIEEAKTLSKPSESGYEIDD